jgi:hypothetical protein
MWIKYADAKPARSGVYLTIGGIDSDGICYPCSCEYYEQGAVIFYKRPDPAGTAEERLIQAIMDESLAVRAPAAGFYEVSVDEETCWSVIPDYWCALPEPPEGLTYYTPEE